MDIVPTQRLMPRVLVIAALQEELDAVFRLKPNGREDWIQRTTSGRATYRTKQTSKITAGIRLKCLLPPNLERDGRFCDSHHSDAFFLPLSSLYS